MQCVEVDSEIEAQRLLRGRAFEIVEVYTRSAKMNSKQEGSKLKCRMKKASSGLKFENWDKAQQAALNAGGKFAPNGN